MATFLTGWQESDGGFTRWVNIVHGKNEHEIHELGSRISKRFTVIKMEYVAINDDEVYYKPKPHLIGLKMMITVDEPTRLKMIESGF